MRPAWACCPGRTGSSSGGQTGGATSRDTYFPPAEGGGGWRVGEARALGVDADRLQEAIRYQDEAFVTRSRGGALVIIYRGHIIGESYVTGTEGGPQRWTARTCNDMKSSTKSVFGTAVWGLSGRIQGPGWVWKRIWLGSLATRRSFLRYGINLSRMSGRSRSGSSMSSP